MKIAKKVLAAVMAVAMIFALSAMAFAADGSIVATAGKVSDKGVVEITFTAKNAIGLQSFDLTIEGTDGFTPVKVAKGPMHDAAAEADNAITFDFNKDQGKFSGYFKFNLWAKDAWVTAAEDNLAELPAAFDPANFVLGVLSAKVDADKYPITVTVKGSCKCEGGTIDVDQTLVIGEKEKPTDPVTDPVTDPKPTDPKPTDPKPTDATNATEGTTGSANPSTTKPTQPKAGDNMALAAAAAVVVLAGAAFVISKKRK